MMVWRICLLLAVWALLGSPLQAAENHARAVQIGERVFSLEVANTPDSRRQGLMGRETLPAGTGMLFDFPEGTRPAIWMYNMVIGLDLLFVDQQGSIVQQFPSVPPCIAKPCALYRAEQPLRYVLELPSGSIAGLGLKPGDRLDLSMMPERAPAR